MNDYQTQKTIVSSEGRTYRQSNAACCFWENISFFLISVDQCNTWIDVKCWPGIANLVYLRHEAVTDHVFACVSLSLCHPPKNYVTEVYVVRKLLVSCRWRNSRCRRLSQLKQAPCWRGWERSSHVDLCWMRQLTA